MMRERLGSLFDSMASLKDTKALQDQHEAQTLNQNKLNAELRHEIQRLEQNTSDLMKQFSKSETLIKDLRESK